MGTSVCHPGRGSYPQEAQEVIHGRRSRNAEATDLLVEAGAMLCGRSQLASTNQKTTIPRLSSRSSWPVLPPKLDNRLAAVVANHEALRVLLNRQLLSFRLSM